MVKVSSVAEALEQIRQGCTELNLYGACRGAALPTHRPRHRRTRMHACRRGACGAPAPSARRTRARRAHTARAPAPRAAGNSIGDEGAKELAAALKANATLTTLNLQGACRAAALPIDARRTAARACTRARGGVRRASPERTPHARSPRPHRACPCRACRRQ